MKDVAKATGLSLATVSRVFNESDKVSVKTRKVVLQAAEQLKYRPNKMAAALRSGKSKTIGVVVPVIDRNVFFSSIKSMEEVLSKAGYNIIICQSHESLKKEIEIIDNLKQLHVDGVIISVSKETNNMDHIEELFNAGIEVVLFDRVLEICNINSVVINNYNGAFQATNHLIQQGCQRIIHLAGKDNVAIFRERKRGFIKALEENGLPNSANQIIPFDDGTTKGVSQLEQLLRSENRPDGIFANGDIAALVAYRVIKEANIKIPEEIAVIGFGNSLFCSYLSPTLSSVNQRNEDVGRLSASMLLENLRTEEKQEVVSQRMLPPELMIRTSTTRIVL